MGKIREHIMTKRRASSCLMPEFLAKRLQRDHPDPNAIPLCRLTGGSPEAARRSSLFAPTGLCDCEDAPDWSERAMDPCHAFPPEVFFSAAEGVVVPLLLSLNPDRSHADSGGARRRRMAARHRPARVAYQGTGAWRVCLAFSGPNVARRFGSIFSDVARLATVP